MALPFLPAADITRMFLKITERVPATGKLRDLINYFQAQWIAHPTFSPRSWSVFNIAVRTTNFVEEKKVEEEAPAKLLDDLFRKTKATPCIYWLPLTEEQIELRQREKKQRLDDRLKRRKEEDEQGHRAGRDADFKRKEPVEVGGRDRDMNRDRDRNRDRERERMRQRERQPPPRRSDSRSRSRSRPVRGRSRSDSVGRNRRRR